MSLLQKFWVSPCRYGSIVHILRPSSVGCFSTQSKIFFSIESEQLLNWLEIPERTQYHIGTTLF